MATKMKYDTASFKERLAEVNPNVTVLGEYVNTQTKIECTCVICGYLWDPIPSNLFKGKGCPRCAGNERHTTQSFKDRLRTSNPSITLCGEYVNGKTKVLFECEVCGYQWSAFPGNVLRGVSGCPRCSKKERYTTQSFKEKMHIVNPNIRILGEYENCKTKIECECMLCGYRWEATSASLLQGKGCHRCAGQERYTTDSFIKSIAKINSNVTVLGEYINNKTKILCRCNVCGHSWEASPSVLIRGGGCPNCCHIGTSFAEQFICNSLKVVLGDENVLSRDKTAIGKEIDIYIPSYRFAIEFNGWEWHKNKFKQDNEKAFLCKEKGIDILFIYDACPAKELPIESNYLTFTNDLGSELHYTTLKEIVRHVCNHMSLQADINQKGINSVAWDNITKEAILNSRRKTTEKFKKELSLINQDITILGEYVSTHKNIACECKKCGHKWEAAPANLLRGKGCPRCSKRKYTKDSFEEELKKYNSNIIVLGDFVTVNKKTLCQCTVCGHKWRPRLSGLLGYRGCPACARQRQKHRTTA